ncbi:MULTISPECIES: anthranilate phosphoribosyltransferase [Methanothrix]|uniref:Anthranilate phosphoribosyltransferase n=1 Tax=Methanothrix soehngenii TaxID=2223 RepID=A0A7K4AJK2_METSH|nr:anthranilate phosphoribosyltransferase [Methanothrix soehngenii]
MSEESLKHFGGKVDELIKGRNLTRGEASDLFRQILNDEQPDLQQGAFLAAITAKGATAEEIAGIWEAIYEVDTLKVRPCVQGPLADNCGTGMDSIKTFNISTAASIVAAADKINMAKHGSRAITSSCGTVDMLEQLGIDVDCDVDLVKRSIEVAGIGIFNGMSGKVHPSALSRILSQIRFGTVLNIAGSLANPALPAYGVRGVYSREMVLPIARAMKEIGYKRAFVIHGRSGDDLRGMDELSTLGRTDVAELDEDGRIREYALNACDLGLEKGDESALLNRGNIEEEAVRLLRVLSGFDRGDRRDIVCLNAAPLLCITGRSEDLLEGVEKAGDIIDSGLAVKKLLHWVREQNRDPGERLERLEGMLELARA